MTENTRYRLTAIAVALPAFMSAKAFAAGASEPGLPQLDIATWPSQLFWLVVLFGAGYVVMAKMVTPRIGAVLEERRQTLDGDLEKARNASADAAKTRAEYESDLEKARSDAAEFAKQAAMEATKKAEAADAKVARKLADKVASAEAALAKAKTEALANLNDVAAEAAMDAVAALAGIKTTSAQAGKTAASIATKLAKQGAN
ncbi:MAG: ATP F0F1 synthase subunit B [Candidatus Puniceispirillaceae bacterium]|jgi:F-type H+-transporting ATPase subunit b|nr:ATP F0F1 synthase subunit B' [Alphaproteobacteria bacterium]HAE08636.1 ATP F0F1 synthase subunit B' [Alphaproteobacteria bacterium]